MKTAAILQSSYIPWKGYFDIIRNVDEFILYDNVQYTRRDWRNRNKIKTVRGSEWITIPVESKGNYLANINEITIADKLWSLKHWSIIEFNYKKAKYFPQYSPILKKFYRNISENYLSKINYKALLLINQILDIKTKITWSTDYPSCGKKTDKIISILKQANVTHYISGPSAKNYIEEPKFIDNNIKLMWADYSNYPEYHQLNPPFDHKVSIIDLLFNEGPNSINYLKNNIS